jgi:DNA-binding CsgD family transcriptional regulator
VGADRGNTRKPTALLGREADRRVLDQLVDDVQQGLSRSLVLTGEAGVGKTRLLDHLAETPAEVRIEKITGAESEQQLAFAALHRLLRPFLAEAEGLPEAQREALLGTFGLVPVASTDHFLVKLASLGLLSIVATGTPLICIVDDVQWIDRETIEVLLFVAQRLDADRIGLLFGLRIGDDEEPALVQGLAIHRIGGLAPGPARELLAAVNEQRLDEQRLSRVIAETGGNPLALIELSAELGQAHLSGQSPLPVPLAAGGRLEAHFLRQIRELPARTQQLLLLASGAPADDPAVLWRAAERLGLTPQDAEPAVLARILVLDPVPRFRHPLIRSAVHGGARPGDQRQAHAALAAAVDRDQDPERRAWHLSAATLGPDEAVAQDLEQAGTLAYRRGGYSAQAALLLRAAELTPETERRAQRLFTAAEAHLVIGDRLAAQQLFDQAAPQLSGPVWAARVQQLRATLTTRVLTFPAIPSVLLETARNLPGAERAQARGLLLDALSMALMSRRTIGTTLEEIAQAVLDRPRHGTGPATVQDLMLDAFALRLIRGAVAAAPMMRELMTGLSDDDLAETTMPLAVLSSFAAMEVWDPRWRFMLERLETFDRQTGALDALRITLRSLAERDLVEGRFQDADARFDECETLTQALQMPSEDAIARVELQAWRGDDEGTRSACALLLNTWCEQLGAWVLANFSYISLTVLELSLGRYPEALAQARLAFDDDAPGLSHRVLPDLIEAAVRSGDRATAERGLSRLSERAQAGGAPEALALLTRSRALTAHDDRAEALYREAIEQLTRTVMVPDRARAHLLYGEWLRRRKRRADARAELRIAHELFTDIGAALWAERARLELLATGERARSRTVAAGPELTPKESQIAELAARGQTNVEIASRLFVTTSTVDYHLEKIFRKLEISSRRQLPQALGRRPSTAHPC